MKSIQKAFSFSDLADSSEFEEFCSAFWELTKIPMSLVDADAKNNRISFCPKGKYTRICKLIRSSPKGTEKCLGSDNIKLDEVAKGRIGICYKCHAGLTEITMPIHVIWSYVKYS